MGWLRAVSCKIGNVATVVASTARTFLKVVSRAISLATEAGRHKSLVTLRTGGAAPHCRQIRGRQTYSGAGFRCRKSEMSDDRAALLWGDTPRRIASSFPD